MAYCPKVAEVPGGKSHNETQPSSADPSTPGDSAGHTMSQNRQSSRSDMVLKNISPFRVRAGGNSLDLFANTSSLMFRPA